MDAGYLERSPFRGIRNVRLPRRLVQPYSPEEVARLLNACDTSPLGLRDRALVLVLLDTGGRCSEVVQLAMSDLDLANGRLFVRHGKGGKQLVVAFAHRCEEALDAYVAARGPQPGPLFVAATGHRQLTPDTPLQPNGLKQMLRRLGRRAGVPKVHAHRFRHSFAFWAVWHDARELDVQYLLGHSSGAMVRRYSSAYGSEQAAMRHAAFSPGDQMLANNHVAAPASGAPGS